MLFGGVAASFSVYFGAQKASIPWVYPPKKVSDIHLKGVFALQNVDMDSTYFAYCIAIRFPPRFST